AEVRQAPYRHGRVSVGEMRVVSTGSTAGRHRPTAISALPPGTSQVLSNPPTLLTHSGPMWRSARARWLGALVVVVAVAGCQRDAPSSDAERFCGEARDNADLITHPTITSEAELDATLDFYRLMGQLAPLAI